MALSDAAKEARSLLKLNVSLETDKIKLFEDNRGCEKWTRTQSEPSRTKHIDIAFHHIKDWVKLGKLEIVPVPADLQLADAMTRALPRHRHEYVSKIQPKSAHEFPRKNAVLNGKSSIIIPLGSASSGNRPS